MVNKIHLISGLPRSGSTLLCAILRQNPQFSAAMTSPVAALCNRMHSKMVGGELGVFFDDEKRATMLRGVFNAYYSDRLADSLIFDTNRLWTGKAPLLKALYPQSRIICCVREIGWVIDSIERMLLKNPLQLSKIFNYQPGTSVYARTEALMNADTGLIGLPWSNLREAWFGTEAKRLILIPYDHLAKDPSRTIGLLYKELGEPAFKHDFDNVVYDEPDYDSLLGMPGLHKVKQTVTFEERRPCVPPDIFAKYASSHFWEKPELNVNHVKII